MQNVVLTSATQISPKAGSPLSSQHVPPVTEESATTLTIESPNVENPPESVEQTDVDGNFQAKLDLNYQAHDVALATAKANGHEQTNGLKVSQHHQMNMDDGDEHPDKAKSPCSTINTLFLAVAIVCFALFLCCAALILFNQGSKNEDHRKSGLKLFSTSKRRDLFNSLEEPIMQPYFNLTSRLSGGIIVVLSRRGASVHDILLPYTDSNVMQQYRSIVLKGNQYGSIRFGFDGEMDTMNMKNQLPSDYPLLNYSEEDWTMYGDINAPDRVRFVHGLVEIVYEFSQSNRNELIMTTFVSPGLNGQIVADPTNNIYFNLRGHGNLSTHYLNLTSTSTINIENAKEISTNELTQGQFVDQLKNTQNYFYKIMGFGIGKHFIATMTERETKTKLNIFSDHAGIMIDTSSIVLSNDNTTTTELYGIRISPRQSPMYQTISIFGPTLIVYPSQAIHTTWWQFEY